MSFSNKVEMLLHHANNTTERALPLTPPAQLDSPPSSSPSSSPNCPASPSSSGSATEAANTFVAASTIQNDSFQVSITTQPPLKTVYQRILKPFPTVTLTVAAPPKNHKSSRRRSRSSPLSDDEGDDADGNNVAPKAEGELELGCADVLETLLANSSNSSSNGLFVEATLLRGDNGEPISKCLDGNSIVRFEKNPWSEGVYTATFKKLKILSTSQQLQGILFRLKFTLKKYAGSNFTPIAVPHCEVVSHPVEVFSHSQYLNKKAPKPAGTSSANTRKEFKDIVKKMDGKKVQGALFSVLQAFKDQGGSRSSVLDVVQQVYGGDDNSDAKARGPSRRMSAPSSTSQSYVNPHQQHQPQLVMTAPALSLAAPTTTGALGDAGITASAVEAQFLNELLGKLQIGAISLDDFVNHLIQGLGQSRAGQLLAQMGLGVNIEAPAAIPSLAGFPSAAVLPSFPSNSALDSSNSLAAILNALAHQQTQLAQLQAVQQSQQLNSVNPFLHQQLHHQQQQAQLHQQLAAAAAASSVPVMPKPRRLSSPQVASAFSPTSTSTTSTSSSSPPATAGNSGGSLLHALPSVSLPSSAVTTPSSASSSLSTLADAISSHLHMQPQPQTTSTPSSCSTPITTTQTTPLLPLLPSLVDHMNSFSSSAASTSVVLPPIASTLAAASSSSAGPLPSLFSLCSLASAIDSSAAAAPAPDQSSSRGHKRSFEAIDVSPAAGASPSAAPPSPNKTAKREGDSSASSASASEEKMQWYWKNNSTWEPYAEGVSAQLERAHKNQTTCILVLHDVPYKMDFQSMTQQRTDNPKRWKHIRRGEEN